MKRNTKIMLAVAAAAALALGVYIFAGFLPSETASGESSSGTAGTVDGESGIMVAEAKKGNISIRVEGPSLVEPYRIQEIRSRLSGTVLESAEEGDRIARGEVLVRLDDTDQRNNKRKAELDLQQARLDLQRAELSLEAANGEFLDKEGLFSSGSISRSDFDAVKEAAANAELAVAGARIRVDQSILSLEEAEQLLANTVIRAPFDGVVLSGDTAEGDLVNVGAVLLTFADISRLRLRAEVDEFDIGKVEAGMPVEISADALGDESIRSVVERVSPAAEVVNNISIFTVSTVIRADDGILRPGMSADLSILISDDTGLLVPVSSVSSVRGRSYLDVYANEEIETVRVVTGASDGINIVVTEGLEEGARVIVPQTAGFTLGTGETAAGGSSIIPISVPGSGGGR